MMRRERIFPVIITLLILISTTGYFDASAQDQKYPRGAQYYLGTDDQLLIKVNIWGFVAKPGQYLVPNDTDLISLISFAGGPRDGAKLNSIKLIRDMNPEDKVEKILEVNVQKYINDGNESLIPTLKPGDTIIVSGSIWYHIGEYLAFVTKIATLVQIYWLVVYYAAKG
jgi:hypothetical protein